MRKLLLILLSALSLTAFAQQKKVAVYVMGDDAGINKVLGSKLVAAIARSEEYSAVERTAAFLSELSKEQNYQRTGAVNDNEFSRLGKQFGVQYICVAVVSEAFNEKYLSARLIDVESAQVERTASSSGAIQSLESLVTAANAVSLDLFSSLNKEHQSNLKKVAVYVVENEASKNIGKVLGDKLVAGFTNSGRYIAIERTNSFLSQLSKEQNYQRTGAVDDNDISRLGKQFGVQYVCVADVSDVFGKKFISARLIDVETAEVLNIFDDGDHVNTMGDCVRMANKIASNLSKGTFPEQAAEKQVTEKEEILNNFNYTEDVDGLNMKMIWVEGGEFLQKTRSDDCPERQVTLDGFYIGMFEVSQSQWKKIMKTFPLRFHSKHLNGIGPDYPMYYVSWYEAMRFCQRLSKKTGKKYTLPSNAQWEYVAHGGKYTKASALTDKDVNAEAWRWNNSSNSVHPCGSKRANILGVYDLLGNVSEWCLDYFYWILPCEDVTNPVDLVKSSDEWRIHRGSNWKSAQEKTPGFGFVAMHPTIRESKVGFRVVCIP